MRYRLPDVEKSKFLNIATVILVMARNHSFPIHSAEYCIKIICFHNIVIINEYTAE